MGSISDETIAGSIALFQRCVLRQILSDEQLLVSSNDRHHSLTNYR